MSSSYVVLRFVVQDAHTNSTLSLIEKDYIEREGPKYVYLA